MKIVELINLISKNHTYKTHTFLDHKRGIFVVQNEIARFYRVGNRIDLTNNIIATKSYSIFKYSESKELEFRVDFHIELTISLVDLNLTKFRPVIISKRYYSSKYNDEVIKNMFCFYYFANLTEDIFFDLFKLRASRGLSRINAI